MTVAAPGHPRITVVKTAAKDPVSDVGRQVRYSFLVTNTGNVTLRKVGVSDVMAPPANRANLSLVTCPRTTLAPGESTACTATYTVTQADAAHGSLGNTATAYGTPPSGPVVRSRPHTISFAVTGGEVVIPTGEGAAPRPSWRQNYVEHDHEGLPVPVPVCKGAVSWVWSVVQRAPCWWLVPGGQGACWRVVVLGLASLRG